MFQEQVTTFWANDDDNGTDDNYLVSAERFRRSTETDSIPLLWRLRSIHFQGPAVNTQLTVDGVHSTVRTVMKLNKIKLFLKKYFCYIVCNTVYSIIVN